MTINYILVQISLRLEVVVSARVVISLSDLPRHEESDGETDDDGEEADEDGGDGQRLPRVEGGGALCGRHCPVLVVRDVVLLNDNVNVKPSDRSAYPAVA